MSRFTFNYCRTTPSSSTHNTPLHLRLLTFMRRTTSPTLYKRHLASFSSICCGFGHPVTFEKPVRQAVGSTAPSSPTFRPYTPNHTPIATYMHALKHIQLLWTRRKKKALAVNHSSLWRAKKQPMTSLG